MAFDPKTGRVEDFGLGVPNEGVNTGAYDPLFNRIYGLTHPRGHFVYYDVGARRSVDKGRINNFESICRTLGIDDEGNVYGSFGQGQVFRYDPRTDEIEELPVRLPIRAKGISLGRDYLKSETAWRTVVWDRQTRQFFGVEESATTLFSFNPRTHEVRRLGQLSMPSLRREPRNPVRDTEPDARPRPEALLRRGGPRIRLRRQRRGGDRAPGHLETSPPVGGRTWAKCCWLTAAACSAPTRPTPARTARSTWSARSRCGRRRASPSRRAGKIGGVYYRLALLIYRPR